MDRAADGHLPCHGGRGVLPCAGPGEYVVPILGDGVSEGVSDLQVLTGEALGYPVDLGGEACINARGVPVVEGGCSFNLEE